MEKYIHLILGVLTAIGAVAIVIYGLYIDKMHALGEGVMYGTISVILFHFYKEAKQREEENGI